MFPEFGLLAADFPISPCSTLPPYETGGNMDIRDLGDGDRPRSNGSGSSRDVEHYVPHHRSLLDSIMGARSFAQR